MVHLSILDKKYLRGAEGAFNITFTPDGNFAFIANRAGNSIGILDTRNPDNIRLIRAVGTNTSPLTIVVSNNGRRVYVLTESTVDVFNFNPISGTMSFANSFGHGLQIDFLFGVEQMALDPSETRLFISASGSRELKVFTITGTLVGFVPGVQARGGVAICPRRG